MEKFINIGPWKIGFAYYGRIRPNSNFLDLEEDNL